MSDPTNDSTPTVAGKPIKLPRLVFIISPDADVNYTLASALQERDQDIEITYIRWPLLNAASSLLSRIVDPHTDPDEETPIGSVSHMTGTLEAALVDAFGGDVLGKLICNHIVENNLPDETLVFVDANLNHLGPIIDKFGIDEICVIMFGTLGLVPDHIKEKFSLPTGTSPSFLSTVSQDIPATLAALEKTLGVIE